MGASHAHSHHEVPCVTHHAAVPLPRRCFENVNTFCIFAWAIAVELLITAEMVRGTIILTCLLCLTCSALAQNLNSTAFANLTLIRQNDANFSSNVALPSFPCDTSSPGLVGGYKSLDLDDVDLYYVTQYVLNYFIDATSNLTDCDFYLRGGFNITDACSQVRPPCMNCLCCCNICQECVLLWAIQLPQVLMQFHSVLAGCSGHQLCH